MANQERESVNQTKPVAHHPRLHASQSKAVASSLKAAAGRRREPVNQSGVKR